MNSMLVACSSSTPPARLESALCARTLHRQNRAFRGTGGVSAENRTQGFVPAFLDTETGTVYRACFADGRPAPMHLLDGLPPAVVATRDATGRITALKPTVQAGFLRAERFYTRAQAAAQVGH